MGKKALGKGLNSIFNEKLIKDNDSTLKAERVKLIDIDSNPFQPRKNFDKDEIGALAATIKEHGLIQPISLRKINKRFQIIAGERRFKAYQYLNYIDIDAKIFENISDKQMAEWAIIENIQRVELSPIEEANSYQELVKNHGYSHDDLAIKMGKSRPLITNTLRLLNLPTPVQNLVEKKLLSSSHARSLLTIEDPQKQIELAEKICREGLSVRDVEELRKKSPSKNSNNLKIPFKKDPHVNELESSLQYALGTKVDVSINSKNKGNLKIHFTSVSDLNRIKDLLDNGLR